MLVSCPFMHGVGLWGGVVAPLTQGGTVVTLPGVSFDAHALWKTVEETRANSIVIVGDAFAKPMLQALDAAEAAGRPYDISSVKRIGSSGVMWSSEVKQGLLAKHDMELIDTLGSTEAGGGISLTTRASVTPTARFTVNPTTRVVTDDGEDVKPGSGVVGAVVSGGVVPIGYYKDPEKSARTFRTINGTRYTVTGDFARVEADGTITLLGRGSQCINSGGEKVFPEEVEEAIKRHPSVLDCLVVGIPDPRFGEKIAAVLSTRNNASVENANLLHFVREQLAGYKLPRLIVTVPTVRRAPNGKADYAWAREKAREAHVG
jgi:fatty-acyl-CoA synthase